ncbi:MAG: CPBP family intramembrane metalloprotease [Bacilli bacterium]|nr:CPBP family intramembrane metalloprotease [Bacilli bacterium]
MLNDIKNLKEKNELIYYLIKGALFFLLFCFIDYIELIPMYLLHLKSISGAFAVILNTMKNVILAFILFFVYRKDLIREWDVFRVDPMENLDNGTKYWFLGLVGMIVSNTIINLFFQTGSAGNEQAVQSYITYLPWLMLVNAGLIAPFCEEIVFRKCFRDIFKNHKWAFAIMSGFVFGLMHVIGSYHSWVDLLYIFPYGVLGSAFALAYHETDTIFTSYFLHMFHNTILILSSIISALLFLL